jgi:hypothetical protein
MQVIITYSDEAFAKLAAYANANSKTLEQYLRSNLSWAAKQFISVDVIPSPTTVTLFPAPLKAEKDETAGEPELYISDKPYKSKRKKKRKYTRRTPSVCVKE